MDRWVLFWRLFSRTNKKTLFDELQNYQCVTLIPCGRVALAVWECPALHPSQRAAANEALGTPGALGPPGKPSDSWGAPWTAGDAPRPAPRTGTRRCRNSYTAWQFQPRDFSYKTRFAKSAATFKTPIPNWKIVSYYLCPRWHQALPWCTWQRPHTGRLALPARCTCPQPGPPPPGRGRARCGPRCRRRGQLPGQALPGPAAARTERGLPRTGAALLPGPSPRPGWAN